MTSPSSSVARGQTRDPGDYDIIVIVFIRVNFCLSRVELQDTLISSISI